MKTNLLPFPSGYDDLPEAELVTLARARDEAAVRVLIRRCNQQLFRVSRSILHTDSEAEDAVQTAYVTAFTKLESFRGDAGFSTWLTRIVMNESYNRLRRQRPIVELAEYRDSKTNGSETDQLDSMTPPPASPEAEFARYEIRKFLEQAIDVLPEPFRLIYVLRDVQEMSTREVAELLDINLVTVKTRLFRARHLLRIEIRKNIAQEFSGIFPFDGKKCIGMADRVISALKTR